MLSCQQLHRRELEAGNRVDFGALSATLNEVTYGQDVFGWNDIGTLKLSTPWPSDDDLRKHYVSRSDATAPDLEDARRARLCPPHDR